MSFIFYLKLNELFDLPNVRKLSLGKLDAKLKDTWFVIGTTGIWIKFCLSPDSRFSNQYITYGRECYSHHLPIVVQLLSCVWLFATQWTAARCFPVLRYLLAFAQAHVCRVGDAIQPSHPLLTPFPPAFNLSQHQGLFQWVSYSRQVLLNIICQLHLLEPFIYVDLYEENSLFAFQINKPIQQNKNIL